MEQCIRRDCLHKELILHFSGNSGNPGPGALDEGENQASDGRREGRGTAPATLYGPSVAPALFDRKPFGENVEGLSHDGTKLTSSTWEIERAIPRFRYQGPNKGRTGSMGRKRFLAPLILQT